MSTNLKQQTLTAYKYSWYCLPRREFLAAVKTLNTPELYLQQTLTLQQSKKVDVSKTRFFQKLRYKQDKRYIFKASLSESYDIIGHDRCGVSSVAHVVLNRSIDDSTLNQHPLAFDDILVDACAQIRPIHGNVVPIRLDLPSLFLRFGLGTLVSDIGCQGKRDHRMLLRTS